MTTLNMTERMEKERAQTRRIIRRLLDRQAAYRRRIAELDAAGLTASSVILAQKLRIIELSDGEEE